MLERNRGAESSMFPVSQYFMLIGLLTHQPQALETWSVTTGGYNFITEMMRRDDLEMYGGQ